MVEHAVASGESNQQWSEAFLLRKLTDSFHGFVEDFSVVFGVEVDVRSHAASVFLWEESNTNKCLIHF